MDITKNKIVLISPLPHDNCFGGIATWTKHYANFAKQNNLNVKIIDNTPVDGKGNDIATSKNIIKKIVCNFKIKKRIKNILKRDRPDVVHLNTPCTSFACIRDFFFLKIIKRYSNKIVINFRCNIEDQIKKSKIGIFFLKKNLRMATNIFVLNTFSLTYLHNLLSEDEIANKIIVLPNFIDGNFVVNKKIIKKQIQNVVFTGHALKEKGIEELIKLSNLFPNVNFTVVGKITEEYEKLKKEGKIIITGSVSYEDVIDKLDQSDVFIFPSHSEGFSNALLEAMARGLPTIVSNVGANFDMVENKGGIVINKESISELVEAFEKIQDFSVREKMSKWNIEKVKKNYTVEAVMEKILTNYFK